MVVNTNRNRRLVCVEEVSGGDNLAPFVGFVCLHDDELCLRKTGFEILGADDVVNVIFELDANSGNDQNSRPIVQDCLAAPKERLCIWCHGWNDHGDVLACIMGFLLVESRPVKKNTSNEVDNKTEVAKEEQDDEYDTLGGEIRPAQEIGGDRRREQHFDEIAHHCFAS